MSILSVAMLPKNTNASHFPPAFSHALIAALHVVVSTSMISVDMLPTNAIHIHRYLHPFLSQPIARPEGEGWRSIRSPPPSWGPPGGLQDGRRWPQCSSWANLGVTCFHMETEWFCPLKCQAHGTPSARHSRFFTTAFTSKVYRRSRRTSCSVRQ